MGISAAAELSLKQIDGGCQDCADGNSIGSSKSEGFEAKVNGDLDHASGSARIPLRSFPI
jgi:hypothetical protein